MTKDRRIWWQIVANLTFGVVVFGLLWWQVREPEPADVVTAEGAAESPVAIPLTDNVVVDDDLKVTITSISDDVGLYVPRSAADLRTMLAQLPPESLLLIGVKHDDGDIYPLTTQDLGAERSCISDAEAWARMGPTATAEGGGPSTAGQPARR